MKRFGKINEKEKIIMDQLNTKAMETLLNFYKLHDYLYNTSLYRLFELLYIKRVRPFSVIQERMFISKKTLFDYRSSFIWLF